MFSNHLPRDLGSETIGLCHPGLCHQPPYSIPLSGLHPLPDPVFLFHRPAIPEHHINSAQHRAVAACRQEVLCPLAPSSVLGPCCAVGVGSGEATTHACGRVALGQTQWWRVPSSSVDGPASAPRGHERCSGTGSVTRSDITVDGLDEE